ncbi:sodium-dependent glucose transporter 1A-like isoform X2 [Varroa jacobsoni]|uniref:sodium-dependent glucose transporter 1A-like isoform X2 n=1 Tax=Varroa jacobsoni TaxID=62625 RepID=UPI000BF8391B|nr:sodium-dependent glucose transporter 1A-like isoform X2 [Varroa jacobsoni]
MQLSSQVIKILQTINMNTIVACMGMMDSSYGATLLDLAEIFHTSVHAISFTLTTKSAGALFGGLMYRSCNIQLVLAVCALLSGLLAVLVPLLPNVIMLHIVSFILGSILSTADVGMHVWIQVIWRHKAGFQLQLYNLVFGLGGIVAPFICEPFLSSSIQNINHSSGTLHSASDTVLLDTTAATALNLEKGIRSASRIYFAYGIMGGILLAAAISIIVLYTFDRTDPKPGVDSPKSNEDLPQKSKYTIITLLSIYLFLGIIDEVTFSAYLPTFAVCQENLRLSKSSAAYLASAFWTSFTIGRLFATLLTLKFSPGKLIAVFHFILMIATLGMLFYIKESVLVVWLGTIMVSFGLGPFFGNATVWGIQYIVLTHNHMSVIFICVCAGMTIPGLLIGPFIDSYPMVLMWGHAVLATTLTGCAILLLIYGRTSLLQEFKRKKANKDKT